MLKRIWIRKIIIASLALVALLLIYIMPSNDVKDYELSNNNIDYIYTNDIETIYLLDSNNYVARTTIKSCNCETLDKVKDLTEGLIIDGEKSNIIPSGFRSIIPSGTQILDLNLENKILTINFSKELLDINAEHEEKMLEAIIYTLTNIDGIDKVIIQVEGEKLSKLPNTNKTLPTILDKSYGINKSYSLINTNSIDKYTIYYVSSYNNNEYYVPVTKYINNSKQDKIKVIIDELSTSPIYETNLMSYLNANVSLINYSLDDTNLNLNFNDSILNDTTNNKILEEVIYTISLSVMDNFNVEDLSISVNNEEIYKKSLKNLEIK